MRPALLAALIAASSLSLRADFSYQETTKMTGGTIYTLLKAGGPFTRKAREAQVSTVAVKGNRMVRTDKDSATIIDLDAETLTEVDLEKKRYSVVTFAQIRAAMEKALADAQKEMKKSKKDADANVEANFKVTAKATGQTKNINGMSAKELVVGMEMQATDKDSGATGAMNVVSDAWMANVRGYDEVKAFELKMAQKLAGLFHPSQAQMALAQPQMVQGLAEAAKEMAKVDGVPVETIVKMGAGATEELMKTGSNGESGEEKGPSAGKVAASAAAGAITGRLGGFGGFGRKKEEPKEEKAEGNDDAPKAALLIEMTTQMSDFSTAAVDAARFSVPAGFKEVESELAKRAKKK